MTAPEPPRPADVALAYLASFADGDPDRIASLVADDFENVHTSSLGRGCRGREAYRERLPGFLASLPELRYEPEQVIADGPSVAVAYRLTARSGDHPVDIRGVMLFEVQGGRISRRTDYWDSLTYLRQTGAA